MWPWPSSVPSFLLSATRIQSLTSVKKGWSRGLGSLPVPLVHPELGPSARAFVTRFDAGASCVAYGLIRSDRIFPSNEPERLGNTKIVLGNKIPGLPCLSPFISLPELSQSHRPFFTEKQDELGNDTLVFYTEGPMCHRVYPVEN